MTVLGSPLGRCARDQMRRRMVCGSQRTDRAALVAEFRDLSGSVACWSESLASSPQLCSQTEIAQVVWAVIVRGATYHRLSVMAAACNMSLGHAAVQTTEVTCGGGAVPRERFGL
jgi:hypothetical protein